jgi:hypothetical protein
MAWYDLIKDYITASSRPLTEHEIALARGVFANSIPYRKILIQDDLGAGGAPWTEPGGGAMELYFLHLGKTGFISTSAMESTLIHELTHVWQGHNHFWGSGFVIGSGIAQGLSILTTGDRGGAYNYKAGEYWGSYNSEQQAHIVEDWFDGGQDEKSPLFRYIRDNIRRPIRSWIGETLVEIGEGASAIKG